MFLKGRKIQRYYCSEAIELLRTQSSRFAFPIMLLMKSGTRIPKTRKLESDKIKPDLHPTDSQTQHSYIAKKTVHSLRRSLSKALCNISLLVVERVVEANALQPAALIVGAGKPDDVAALDLGDLPDEAANRPSSAGDDDSLAGLGLADLEEAEVGRVAGHPTRSDQQTLAQAAWQVWCWHHASKSSSCYFCC